MKYYVYEYLRDDGTPYYIGKGTGKRWQEKHTVNIPPKNRVRFVAEHLTEQAAWDLEIALIAKYGRKDLGTGILRNLTDGGDGASGYVHSIETKIKMSKTKTSENAKRKKEGWTYPDSARRAISEMQKGVPKPKEWVKAVSIALNSRSDEEKAEWKAKLSASKKGRPRSEETKAKIRATMLAKKFN